MADRALDVLGMLSEDCRRLSAEQVLGVAAPIVVAGRVAAALGIAAVASARTERRLAVFIDECVGAAAEVSERLARSAD